MSIYDGSNNEGQGAYATPQNQQRRGVVNARELSPQARRIRQEAWAKPPATIFPPQTQNEAYPAQPMLESDSMGREMDAYRRYAEGLGYQDPVSPSNPENFATIGLPYIYCLDQATGGFIELASGASTIVTIQIMADGDFVLQAIAARATREFTYTMTDSGADRRLSSQPVSAVATLGGTGRVFAPTTPQLMSAATSILIQITDGGDQSPNIYSGARVANANLEPSVADPLVLVNKIGLFLVGVKRKRRDGG